MASRRGVGCCWPTRRSRGPSPRPLATAGLSIWTSCSRLKPLASDSSFQESFLRCQAPGQSEVRRLAEARPPGRWLIPTPSSTARSSASTNTSGNCSTRCAWSCSTTGCATNPKLDLPPRTFFFAGKAAPAYHLAKLIIKFINNLAAAIDARPGGARTAQGRVPAGLLRDAWPSG